MTVVLPVGDITSAQMRAVAKIALLYADGTVRNTPQQNMLLRWVPVPSLPAVWRRLRAAGLAEPGAGGVRDIVSCPGASTCSLAFTTSMGLAGALRARLAREPDLRAAAEGLSVKISGCPNSCGHHHIADIGFHGALRRAGAREVPAYVVLVGGAAADGRVDFARPVARVPARRAPDAFAAIVRLFATERREGERFFDFARRIGEARFRAVLAPFEEADPEADAFDWGARRTATGPTGPGECGA